jgi:hypothetical protein
MAHPDVEQPMTLTIAAVLDALEQGRVAVGAHFRIAELSPGRAFDLASQLRGHGLHAVADTENGHAEFEHHLRCLEVLDLVDRIRTAREDDALRLEVADELLGDVIGMQFAVHLLLAHAASDQLRDLRAKVENQDLLMGHRAASNDTGGLPPPADRRVLLNRRDNWELPW